MDDPCLIYSLSKLRDMARGKVPGFSKMKKRRLCDVLIKKQLLPPKGVQFKAIQGFRGIAPPEWDFDRKNPIPTFLLPYDYIYTAGSMTNEVVRYFILHDNYSLIGTQLPNREGTIFRHQVEILAKDYLDQLEENPDASKIYFLNNEEVELDSVYIKGLTKNTLNINRIAPRVGSVAWFDLLSTLQIVGIEAEPNRNPELRREYQIITRLAK